MYRPIRSVAGAKSASYTFFSNIGNEKATRPRDDSAGIAKTSMSAPGDLISY